MELDNAILGQERIVDENRAITLKCPAQGHDE
jgi:hypothetical protein